MTLPAPYYEADGIVIFHGDCREILPLLEEKADLVVTDPPYAVSVAGSAHVGVPGKGTRRLDFFDGDDDWPAVIAMWRESLLSLIAAATPTASGYAWVGHRQFGPTIETLEANGFSTRFLVWAKKCPAPPPPGSGWPSGAELCVFWYPNSERCWTHDGSNAPKSNVIVADSFRHGQPGKVDHPTQKPERLIAPLILASSRPGDLVLDGYAGSGSVLVTARAHHRRAIGIEIEERYCEIAAKRLSQRVLDFGTAP